MRQAWLVLAIVAAAVDVADAKRVECSCPTRIVLPERGATGLPINTKVWIVDVDGRVQQRAPELAPNRELVDDSLGIQFTTGAQEDKDAPEAPRQVGAYVAIQRDTGVVESVSMFGAYAADTALVRIRIDDATGSAEIVTTPRRLFLCQPRLRLAPTQLRVEVTAIDIAGNESIPYVTRIEPSLVAEYDAVTKCPDGGVFRYHHHHDHGMGILLLLFLYVIVLAVWLVLLAVRRLLARRALAEPLSLLEAEEVVRRMLRWQVLWSAMSIALIIALLGLRDEIAVIFALCLVPHAGMSLIRMFVQRRAQYLLGRPEPVAVRHGRWLDVTASGDSVLVRAADYDFVIAKRSSIPRSVAQ